MIPIIKLYDLNFTPLALIDDYESFFYEEKYDDVGTCTLKMSASTDNFKEIQKNLILYLDKFHCWYIEDIEIENDSATITALSLAFIFSHRIIIPLINETHLRKTALSGKVIEYLIDKTIINSTDKTRNIPFVFTNDCNVGHKITFESRFRNLLEEMQRICIYSALGFRVGIDIVNKKYLIDIHAGNDLSSECIFSEVFDNIDDIKIADSNSGYKNVVYVAGQGQGVDRKVVTITNTDDSGWFRREEMKDSRDKETEEALIQEAETILSENTIKTSIEFVLLGDDEVEVGDIVTVMTKKYNFMFTQRIIQKNIEFSGTSGKVVEIIIGNPKPTLTFKNEGSVIE